MLLVIALNGVHCHASLRWFFKQTHVLIFLVLSRLSVTFAFGNVERTTTTKILAISWTSVIGLSGEEEVLGMVWLGRCLLNQKEIEAWFVA